MRNLRIAACLVALYGIILVGNAIFYWSWSGDAAEFPRLLLRLLGCCLVFYGLWLGVKWGWWFGALFTGILALLGLLSVVAALSVGVFDARPYPTVDLIVAIGVTASLFSGFVLIVTPTARQAVNGSARTGQ